MLPMKRHTGFLLSKSAPFLLPWQPNVLLCASL